MCTQTPTKSRGRPYNPDLINWDIISLGQRSDKDIATDLGVSAPAVRKQRVRRGISSFPKRSWDTSLVGTMPDGALARLVGRNSTTIMEARHNLGLPPVDRKYMTTEGERATLPEAIIDLYWHCNSIHHNFQYRVGRYVADWLIEKRTIVEYAGLSGSRSYPHYDRRLQDKKIFYETTGYDVLVIYPDDLSKYNTKNPLRMIDALTPKRNCIVCGVELKREFDSQFKKVKLGMCRSCAAKYRNRDYSNMLREKNNNWHGGVMQYRGYKYILMPDHPRANKHGYVSALLLEKEGNYVPEIAY